MLKRDYFLAAMKAGLYRKRAWVLHAFAITSEDPEAWRKDPYPYRLVQTRTGALFVDPESKELVPLEDTTGNAPPFGVKEMVELQVGDVPNLAEPATVQYGAVLNNYITLIWPFGTKIPFQLRRHTPGDLESLILPIFVDAPDDPADRREDLIYPDEYENFCEAISYLENFTQVCVPAATEKLLTAPPGIQELRKKLLEQYKGRLHDQSVLAEIQEQLKAVDKEYLKGDLSEGFLLKGKLRNVVRPRLYLMYGAETGLDEGVDVTLIEKPLSEGWDPTKFPEMNDSLRAGAYNRGYQTMLGGVEVKWLQRASANLTANLDDCGTKIGFPTVITEKNAKSYLPFSVVTPNGHEKLTKDNIASYYGKNVMVRLPSFCRGTKTDYCKVCVGERLAAHPAALSSAVSEEGSALLSMFMAAAHARELATARLDVKGFLT